MKDIITPVHDCIMEPSVKSLFLHYLNKPDGKNNTESAFEKLTQHYSIDFAKYIDQIKLELLSFKTKQPQEFSEFLVCNYTALRLLLDNNTSTKPIKLNFKDPNIDIKKILPWVEFQFQKEFVLPLISFMETSYLSTLIDDCVYPLPIENFSKAINTCKIEIKLEKSVNVTT